MNKLSLTDRVRIVRCLVEGNSIRSTCRITGFAKGTVLKLLVDLGDACARFHDERVRDVDCKRVQCDELWAFCYAKDRTVQKRPGLKDQGAGDVWTWTGLDADTKLMVSWLMADKGPESAQEFMHDLAGRVVSRMQLTTDGNRNYLIAVPGAFGHDIDYAMIKKIYGDPKPDGRIGTSQLACIGTKKQRISGSPDMAHVSTSYVERQNLTIRMCSRRYTRLTNAFSKKLENHGAALALHFTFYNFCRVHQTLKMTPAMAAGLALHAWPLEELVNLLESEEQTKIEAGALKRGSYKPRNSK
jgi:IS1 family transposase